MGGCTLGPGYSLGCSRTGMITGCGGNMTVAGGGKCWPGGTTGGPAAGTGYTRRGGCCTGMDGGKGGLNAG